MVKHFVYFSKSASTSGKALSQGNLMKAGRIDIAIHSFIQAVYLSKDYRKDVVFHFVFYGMPDPPKHLEIRVNDETPISKKDVGKIIQKMLYKYREKKKTEVFPGCHIEKKSFMGVVDKLLEEDCEVFILDKKGSDIRKTKFNSDPIFILGDHEGLDKKEIKRLKKVAKKISVGPEMYFSSQVVAVVNNELDRRS